MNPLALLLLLATSLAAGCAPKRVPAPPPSALAVTVSDDDDLREAVFRHLFDHNASGQQRTAQVFCLQVENARDPSEELLKRFGAHTPPVKPASRCTVKRGTAWGGVQDDTGARGLIFRVDSIRRTGPETAEIEGGYFEAGLSASGNVYELVKEGRRWVVKTDTMQWIS
jgi:hypothetical protein